jgi:DNA-binding transcriptional MerR regulator
MGERHYSPAEVSRLFGVSSKALRLYETRGLIRAVRTANGWRCFGRAEIARLHQVLALKALRLSLARIAELLNGGVSLDQILAAHEKALADEATQAARALGLVRAARAKLAAGRSLSIDDLATLAKETTMPLKLNMTDAGQLMKPLIHKHFTDADLEEVKRDAAPYDRDKVARQWDELLVEADHLTKIGDVTSPEAVALARRWKASVAGFSVDPAMRAKAQAVWADAMADPEVAPKLPINPDVFAFVRRVLEQTGDGAA